MVWFGLTLDGYDTAQLKEAREWLNSTSKIMWRELNRSNFHEQVHEVYLDLCAFGTGCLLEEENEDREGNFTGIRFEAHPIRDYLIEENEFGIVDRICILREMTARQMAKKWGKNKLDKNVLKALSDNDPKLWPVLHWVTPRDEFDYRRSGKNNMPYQSIWIDEENRHCVHEGGYPEFPVHVPRWAKSSGEKFGRGPGISALPDIKVLNEATRLELNAWAKAIDPPLMIQDDGVIGDNVDLRPAAANVVRTLDAIKPIDTGARWDVNRIKLDEYRLSIRQAFFADQLELPQQGPEMTATEVQVRFELMQRILGPTLGRLEVELLNPVISRTFQILYRNGAIDPMPEFVNENATDVDISYVGPLSRAQKAAEVSAFLRYIQSITPLAQLNPQVLDNIDFDECTRWLHEQSDLPEKLMIAQRQIDMMRRQRAEAAQAAATEQEAAATADNAQKLATAGQALTATAA